jgi:hypothetical protein
VSERGPAGDPVELLALASSFLSRADASTAGLWPRAAAVLTRQALEAALDDFWAARKLPFDPGSGRKQQLICLREYMTDKDAAGRAHHTWQSLSRACHHHAYELAPTAVELRGWIEEVGRVRAAMLA